MPAAKAANPDPIISRSYSIALLDTFQNARRTLSGYRDDGASPCSAATDLLDQHLTTITNRIHELQTVAVLILLEEDRRSWAR